MSEFLKFAFELISQIVYFLVDWIVHIFSGFIKLFFTGMPVYGNIVQSYFPEMGFFAKILAILLCLILIAIPIILIVIIVRRIVMNIKLKATQDDNVTLYKEIGRLNKQVLALMDEKNMILAMKTGVSKPLVSGEAGFVEYQGEDTIMMGDSLKDNPGGNKYGEVPTGTAVQVAGATQYVEGSDLFDPLSDGPAQVAAVSGAPGVIAGVSKAGVPVSASANFGEDAISAAATAAAMAAAKAKTKAEEQDRNSANRFPKLHLVDQKYEHYDYPELNSTVSLEDFTDNFRLFAASQMGLYYTPEIIRRFVAGMSASKLLILEGISGTGKTSLPYAFSRYLDYPATIVSVQPSFRDRTELLGYFNEFSKRFNETEFLRAIYEAGYREDPNFIVLDEMNLARIEYYFAEMLSVLEMPNVDEWVIDLVPTAWSGDPELMDGGKIQVNPNTWFVGTANNDDSTFTITDKVYDRAMPIELNERADAFECELQPRCQISYDHLVDLFEKAKEEHPISEATLAKMVKLDQYIQTRFKLSFGNRIVKQMYDFIPVYVACGGTELGGMDYIIARKVLKKFESQNVAFVRDEIKGLISYIDKTFGANSMPDSKAYLTRIQNLY